MSKIIWRLDNIIKDQYPTNLIDGLQMARFYNILNANIRITSAIHKENSRTTLRDETAYILYHSAIVSESIDYLHMNKALFKELSVWQSKDLQIEFTKKEIKNKNSFTRSVLKKIRNKVISHYDKNVITSIITDTELPLTNNSLLAQAEAPDGSDFTFTLLDDIILKYVLIQYQTWSMKHTEEEDFLIMLIKTSNNLMWTLKKLIAESLKNYMYWEEVE